MEIGSGTPVSIQLQQHVPMQTGAKLEGRLLYPIYVGNQIALPQGSTVRGRVTAMEPDRSRRIHARLRGDFTPFRNPVVQFDQVVLQDGTTQPMMCASAKDGAVVLHLSPPPAKKKGNFLTRQLEEGKQRLRESAALITAPGRGDRLVQLVYTQLPYHPQRIETGTSWTAELAQPLVVTVARKAPSHADLSVIPSTGGALPTQKPGTGSSPERQATEWQLRAYLQQTITSARAKPGDLFQAYVAEPVFNSDKSVVVPEGSLLVGEITQSRPARSFGRQGKLRFRFRELRLPSGFSQPVEGALSEVDAGKAANLQIDSEGAIQPKSQNRVVVPLILALIAGRAFDDDGSRAFNNGVASNGFGIIGRVVGIAASSRNVAAGIGIYSAALSFYDLWIARGHNVVFEKNTRVEVTTTPGRNPLRGSPPYAAR